MSSLSRDEKSRRIQAIIQRTNVSRKTAPKRNVDKTSHHKHWNFHTSVPQVKVHRPKGNIPVDAAAASPEDKLLKKNRGICCPVGKDRLTSNRSKDETQMIKVFRTYDSNFDGALQREEFRQALNFMGFEQKYGLDTVYRVYDNLDHSGVGSVPYRDAVNVLSVDHSKHSTKSDDANSHPVAVLRGEGQGRRMASTNRRFQYTALHHGHPNRALEQSASVLGTVTYGDPTLSELTQERLKYADMEKDISPSTNDVIQDRALDDVEKKLLDGASGSVRRLVACLKTADSDNDGKVAFMQMKSVLRRTFNVDLSNKELKTLQKHFDVEKSGLVDYRSLGKVISTQSANESRGKEAAKKRRTEDTLMNLRDALQGKSWRMHEIFKALDVNHDDHISGEELAHGLHKMNLPIEKAEINHLVGRIRNGELNLVNTTSGGIRYGDFVNAMTRPLKPHDTHLHSDLIPSADGHRITKKWKKQLILQGDSANHDFDFMRSSFVSERERHVKNVVRKLVTGAKKLNVNVHDRNSLKHYFNQFRLPQSEGKLDTTALTDKMHQMGIDIDDQDFSRVAYQIRRHNMQEGIHCKDIVDLLHHEGFELLRRPDMSTTLRGGGAVAPAAAVPREKGKRIYHEAPYSNIKQGNFRSDILDYHDNDEKNTVPSNKQFNLGAGHRVIKKLADIVKIDKSNIKRAFTHFDRNNDGVVTTSEFKDAIRKKVKGKLKEPEIELLAYAVDSNRNGLVEYKEFIDHMSKVASMRNDVPGESKIPPAGLGRERLDPWGNPLSLPSSERTYNQKVFETYGRNAAPRHDQVQDLLKDPTTSTRTNHNKTPSTAHNKTSSTAHNKTSSTAHNKTSSTTKSRSTTKTKTKTPTDRGKWIHFTGQGQSRTKANLPSQVLSPNFFDREVRAENKRNGVADFTSYT